MKGEKGPFTHVIENAIKDISSKFHIIFSRGTNKFFDEGNINFFLKFNLKLFFVKKCDSEISSKNYVKFRLNVFGGNLDDLCKRASKGIFHQMLNRFWLRKIKY